DQQGFLLDVRGQPAPALQVHAQLVEARLRRGVQCQQGVAAEQAVGLQAVVELEALQGSDQRLVVVLRFVLRQRRRQITLGAQPSAQQRYSCIALAGLEQRAVRQLW